MQPRSAAQSQVFTDKRKTRPFGCLSLGIGLFGFALAFACLAFVPKFLVLPALGIAALFIVGSIVLDQPRYLCGHCGNRVEKTSRICASCHAAFNPQKSSLAVDFLLVVVVIVFGLLLWLLYTDNPEAVRVRDALRKVSATLQRSPSAK